MADAVMSSPLKAVVNYFSSDPKFQLEKPYVTSFPVDGIPGAKVTNHESDKRAVTLYDMRTAFPHDSAPSLDTQGFTYLRAATALTESAFESSSTICSQYFEELRMILKQNFPQYHTFVFFDHEIRRRSPLYPSNVGAKVTHSQPLAQPHVDYTLEGARVRLKADIPESHAHLLSLPCDLLNVWRPLHGPVQDWPLAFCSFPTIDSSLDVLANDVVYENSVGEDAVLRYNPVHEWYYLDGQQSDEIFVWRNTNLPGGDKPCAFHTAFDLPVDGPPVRPRESIEVRVAAFHN